MSILIKTESKCPRSNPDICTEEEMTKSEMSQDYLKSFSTKSKILNRIFRLPSQEVEWATKYPYLIELDWQGVDLKATN